MSKQKGLQRISIVFEETGEDGKDSKGEPGKRFNVYLDGHTRNLNHVNEKDLSPAEFWAMRMFAIVTHYIGKAGAVETVHVRPDGGIAQ